MSDPVSEHVSEHEHDQDRSPGDELTDEQRAAIDEWGFRAGAELRRSPPPGGAQAIARIARPRRLALAGVAAVGVVALVTVGIVVFRHEDPGIVQPADTRPVPASVTTPATSAPTVTAPRTSTPATTQPSAPVTTERSITPPTTAPTVPATLAPIAPGTEFPIFDSFVTTTPSGPQLQVAGTAPLWLVFSTDDGRSVHFHPFLPLSTLRDFEPGYLGAGRDLGALVIDGTPVVLARLANGYYTTLGITTDGRLLALGANRFVGTLPMPGRVTDAVGFSGQGVGQDWNLGGTPFSELDLWAAGIDTTSGQPVPTVWHTTGLAAGDGYVTVASRLAEQVHPACPDVSSGGSPGCDVATATPVCPDLPSGATDGCVDTVAVATGSAGVEGQALVAGSRPDLKSAPWVVALLPDTDGTSRFTVVSRPDGGEPSTTELRYIDPTALAVSGGSVFVADDAGLHRIDLTARSFADELVWSTPVTSMLATTIGSCGPNCWSSSGASALVALDGSGAVLIVPGRGEAEVLLDDPQATAVFAGSDALIVVHSADDEVIIRDISAIVTT